MGSEYSVQPELRLLLDSISAPVRVLAGPDAKASVEVKGPEDYRKEVKVDFDSRNNQLTVRDDAASSGGVSFGSISMGDINVIQGGRGMSISASGGKMVINGKMSGQVIVNGVDISDLTNSRGGGKPSSSDPDPEVTLRVPVGTAIKVVSCDNVTAEKVKGRLIGDIQGIARLTADGVTSADVTVSGTSHATITDGHGELISNASGTSKIAANGSFDDVRVEAIGTSSVTIKGSAERIVGSASGVSRVDIVGTVKEEPHISLSGVSSATLNGDDIGGSRKRSSMKW